MCSLILENNDPCHQRSAPCIFLIVQVPFSGQSPPFAALTPRRALSLTSWKPTRPSQIDGKILNCCSNSRGVNRSPGQGSPNTRTRVCSALPGVHVTETLPKPVLRAMRLKTVRGRT